METSCSGTGNVQEGAQTSQREDINCAPQSEVILAGTPNRKIQPEIRALVQSAAEMEDRGTASGQHEVLSRMVKR